MKTRFLLFISAFIVFFQQPSTAAITITDFMLTPNSMSFHIDGTMPDLLPLENKDDFIFAHSNLMADPGFVVNNLLRL